MSAATRWPALTPIRNWNWSGSSSPTPTRWAGTPASWPVWASELGVAGTSDFDALLALKPDCIVHTAMADDRMFEALADLERFLAAGINVVSSSPVFLQFPADDDPMAAPVIAAAKAAGVSIFVNGVDPGFANDALPAGAHRHQRAHRRGPLLRGPQLQHLQPAHGALRHHGLRPAARPHPAAAVPGRADHGLGQRGAPDRRRTRRHPDRGDRVVRAGARARGLRGRCRHRPQGHGGRTALRGAGHGGRQGGGRARARHPPARRPRARRGPSRPATAATGCRSPASPTTPSTSN